jgi:hypothetical protein
VVATVAIVVIVLVLLIRRRGKAISPSRPIEPPAIVKEPSSAEAPPQDGARAQSLGALSGVSSQATTCPKCGYINKESTKFCIKCGTSL